MHIGEVAKQAGLPAKTIRFYEDIGLIEPAARDDNGYRQYAPRDINMLRFVQRARSLGFSVDDCRELLALYRDGNRSSADVKAIGLARIDDIDAKIAQLTEMRGALQQLVAACHGDDRPDCPILDGLADGVPND